MKYFEGITFTEDEKKLMIANFLKHWKECQDCMDISVSSVAYAMFKGMQTTLTAMYEELDLDNLYHNGYAKSRQEYAEEQEALMRWSKPYNENYDDEPLIEEPVKTTSEETAVVANWQSLPTELYLGDPEHTLESKED